MARPGGPSSGQLPRPLLGVLFMLGACALFPVMNGIVKFLGAHYDPKQVVWFRITTHLVLVALVFLPRMGTRLFHTRHIGAQFIVSVMMLLSTLSFFSAAKYMGVADAIAVSFVAPLVVVFLAWPILGERITPVRLAAVVVGFLGMLVVIRPGSSVFQWASLLVLASAFCYAIYQIYIRRLAGIDPPATSILYSVLLGTIVMSLIVPFVWITPTSWEHWVLFVSIGAMGALGHYCVARAMTYASANFIAPFNYTQIIGSVVVGFLMFGEVPDLFVWLGTALIVSAGLMVVWSGRKRA